MSGPSPNPTSSPSLAGLVQRAARGDRRAQRALYEDHVGMVYGYCLTFARGDRVVAEDLCQESFARAFSKLAELQSPERFSGWLKVIARRTCLRWIERRGTESRALARFAHEPRLALGTPDRAAEIVGEVILACPDDALRETARLFYTPPPKDTAQVAEALGLSRTAVTSRLHRFRAWARRRMLGRLADALQEVS